MAFSKSVWQSLTVLTVRFEVHAPVDHNFRCETPDSSWLTCRIAWTNYPTDNNIHSRARLSPGESDQDRSNHAPIARSDGADESWQMLRPHTWQLGCWRPTAACHVVQLRPATFATLIQKPSFECWLTSGAFWPSASIAAATTILALWLWPQRYIHTILHHL